ncbi:MAG: galactokinase [Planctomycetota bacterium]
MAETDARARAEAFFTARFGGVAAALAWAPGRVNLIGDHVDYAGGTVLPMSLDAGTAVAIGPSVEDGDRFASEWAGARDPSWTRYAAGVLHELRAHGVAVPPVAVAVAADLAVGAGLSSSASLEVAVARAAIAFTGRTLEPDLLATLCQRAEHAHAGVPCGIMDQWCVAHAAPGEAIRLDCATLAWRPIARPAALRIEIVDSGVRHALRDGGYAARRADVDAAARALGVAHLARLPRARWAEIDALPARIARRARHVVRESARAEDAADALAAGDLARFGALLVESHRSLRDDFEVSVAELDAIVDGALARGALGARMTGGGFGGSAVVAWRA